MNHSFFSSFTPESAWLAGLLAADGSVRKDGVRWSLSQSGEEGKALMEKVARLIKYHLPIRREATSGRDAFAITVTSPTMVQDLSRMYQVSQNKTYTYAFPDSIPDGYIPFFLRGYVDGDGCVGWYPSPRGVPYIQISMVGTQEFINSVQHRVPVLGNIRVIARCKNLVDLRWNGRKAFEVGEYLYTSSEAPLSHKASKFLHYASGNVLPLPDWLKKRLQ